MNCWKWIWSFFLTRFRFEKKIIDIVILIYSIHCDRIFQWFRLMQIEQKYQKIERETIVDKCENIFESIDIESWTFKMKIEIDLRINWMNKSTNTKKISFACVVVVDNIVEKCFLFILNDFRLFDLFKLLISRHCIFFSFFIF